MGATLAPAASRAAAASDSTRELVLTVSCPDASPRSIERNVTAPIERSMIRVSGVEQARSVSRDGVSQIFLTFGPQADTARVESDVRERLAGFRGTIPPTAGEPVVEWRPSTPSR